MKLGDSQRRALELFEQALTVDGKDREALLVSRQAEEPDVVRQVRALLRRDADLEEADLVADAVGREAASLLSHGAPAATLPARIGSYEILDEIGRGGFGIVLKALQASPRREVALKVLRLPLADPAVVRRFEREGEILALVHHPAIASVFETGCEQVGGVNQHFISMELVQGLDLMEYAARNDLDIRARITLMIEVCEALDHAHRAGVVHRDLKPSNVLVDDAGRPRVIDFGIAQVAAEVDGSLGMLTRTGQLLGTPSYMSPEQVLGDRGAVDARSDVYALGALLFEILTGELPLSTRDQDLATAVRNVIDQLPRRPSFMDRRLKGDLDWICLKALEKEPSHRYPSAAALADDLRRFLEGRPVAASPPSVSRKVVRWSRRNRAQALATLVVVAVGLSVSGYLLSDLLSVRRSVLAADRAWTNGDLVDARTAFDSLPSWAVRFWRSGASESAESEADPVQHVLESADRDGISAAIWMAASYVERDGPANHPRLLAFLRNELEESRPNKPWDERQKAALSALARVFFDRPNQDAVDATATSRVRAALNERLTWNLGDGELQDLLVALRGCGDAESIAALVDWLEKGRATKVSDDELLRVALVALERIVRHEHKRADARFTPAEQERMVRVAQTFADESRLSREVAELLVSTVFLRRDRNLPPVRIERKFWWYSYLIKAVQGDPEFLETLQEDPAELLPEAVPRSSSEWTTRVRYLDALQFAGIAAGLVPEEGTYRIAEAAAAKGYEAARIQESLQRAREQYSERSRGNRPDFEPDADTHLGLTLDALDELVVVPCSDEPGETLEGLAWWDFRSNPVATGGSARRLRWCSVQHLADELAPELRWARLAPLERSRIVCTFTRDPAPTQESLRVELSVIKAIRGALPHSGRAILVVLLDGRPLGECTLGTYGDGDPPALGLPVPYLARGDHTLEVRLKPESNTTVRLSRLAVRTL